jgi:hypothetical protein
MSPLEYGLGGYKGVLGPGEQTILPYYGKDDFGDMSRHELVLDGDSLGGRADGNMEIKARLNNAGLPLNGFGQIVVKVGRDITIQLGYDTLHLKGT